MVVATPPPVAAQDGDTAPVSAIESLSSCIQQDGHLSVLMLLDESGSLATTDPSGQRIIAAQAALTTLADLASTQVAGATPTVEVQFAAFGADFRAVTDWSPLDRTTLDDLVPVVASFATRNTAQDTDFANALLGAELTLSEHSSALFQQGITGCNALMLFTDGKLDIETRASGEVKSYAPDLPLNVPGNADLAEQRAVGTLCDAGGVADRLRTSGLHVITIALASSIAAEDQSFIQALTTGTSDTTSCGEAPGTRGQYLPASDLTSLLNTFDSVAGTISGGVVAPQQTIEVCGGTPCESGRHTVDVDGSMRRFTVLITSTAPDVQVQVTDPADSDPITFTRDGSLTRSTASADVTAVWLSPTVLSIEARMTVSPAPEGDWTFVVIDPSNAAGESATLQLTRYGNLFPRLTQDLLVSGSQRSTTVVADIVDEAGVHVQSLPAATILSGRLVDPISGGVVELALEPSSSGYYQDAVDLPETIGTSVELTLTLDVVTDGGLDLPSQSETTTHSVPAGPLGAAPPPVNENLPGSVSPLAVDDDSGGSLVPNGRVLIVLAAAVAVGGIVFWLRRASAARFTADSIHWTALPIAVYPNGQIERLDRRAPLTIEPGDFRPLEVRESTNTFKLLDLRFKVRAPRHPFEKPIGLVRADAPVAGSKGIQDASEHAKAIIDLQLESQWVFRIDEPATLASNRSPTDPHYGEVIGHLVIFVPQNHFKRPSPTLRRSLYNDLPPEARVLLAAAKTRNRTVADRDAGNTLELVEAMLGPGD